MKYYRNTTSLMGLSKLELIAHDVVSTLTFGRKVATSAN
jgi:hypothetical protein